MPLILKITSDHKRAMGRKAVKTFGVHGGTIGRSMENDWVLPCTERFVSGQHAVVENQSGVFYIVDNSTNGVYLNGSDHPIGDGAPQRLYDGDRMRMGSFEMSVRIRESDEVEDDDFTETDPAVDTGDAFDEVATSTMAVEGETDTQRTVPWRSGSASPTESSGEVASLRDTPGQVVGEEASGERRADWSMINIPETGSTEALQPSPDESIEELISTDELSDRVPVLELEDEPQMPESEPEPEPEPEPEEKAPPPKRKIRAKQKSATNTPLEKQTLSMDKAKTQAAIRKKPSQPVTGAAEAVAVLLENAGLVPDTLRSADPVEVLETTGQIMRVMVGGLMEALQDRSELKNRFRLTQTTIQPAQNNPLKFSAGVDEALTALFERKSREYLAPEDAVGESFRDMRNHRRATEVAMRAAFEEFLERFDPAELQERFDRGMKRGPLLGVANKLKYWDLYKELYDVMTARSDTSFPHLFGEEFARVYEETIDAIARQDKKKSAG